MDHGIYFLGQLAVVAVLGLAYYLRWVDSQKRLGLFLKDVEKIIREEKDLGWAMDKIKRRSMDEKGTESYAVYLFADLVHAKFASLGRFFKKGVDDSESTLVNRSSYYFGAINIYQQTKAQYILAVDYYGAEDGAYCLMRKVEGKLPEILLTKRKRGKGGFFAFEAEVDNLKEYFNAEFVEERR